MQGWIAQGKDSKTFKVMDKIYKADEVGKDRYLLI